MKTDPDIHRRRTIRLQGRDYSEGGMYFITLCTESHKHLFGKIIDGKMCLNDSGRIVRQCWNAIPSHFPQVALDWFVIMPNHVHGIIAIEAQNFFSTVSGSVGAKNFSPPRGTARTVGSIVRGFKIGVTKWMRSNTTIRDVWQRNYWEHIIRSEAELTDIREYIQNNPAQWTLDKLYTPSQFDASMATFSNDASRGTAARAKNFSPLQHPWEA